VNVGLSSPDLRARGQVRAQRFNRERTAAQLMEVYGRVENEAVIGRPSVVLKAGEN
jgi:hypothetical protein